MDMLKESSKKWPDKADMQWAIICWQFLQN